MKTRAFTLTFLTLACTVGGLMAQSNGEEVFIVQGRVASVDTGSRSIIEIEPEDGQPRIVRAQATPRREPGSPGLERSGVRVGDLVMVCGILTNASDRRGVTTMSLEQITFQGGRTISFVKPDKALCPLPDVDPAPERADPTAATPVYPIQGVMATAPVSSIIPASILPNAVGPEQTLRYSPHFIPGPPAGSIQENLPPPTQTQPRFPPDPFESGHMELYDRNQPVKLSGKVTDVQWTTPNTYIYLTVERTTWIVEASFVRFRQASIFPGLRVGDFVTVSGFYPKDNPPYDLPARSIPAPSRYLKANRFFRASEIVLSSGQVLDMGLPPTAAEIERRTWCYAGC